MYHIHLIREYSSVRKCTVSQQITPSVRVLQPRDGNGGSAGSRMSYTASQWAHFIIPSSSTALQALISIHASHAHIRLIIDRDVQLSTDQAVLFARPSDATGGSKTYHKDKSRNPSIVFGLSQAAMNLLGSFTVLLQLLLLNALTIRTLTLPGAEPRVISSHNAPTLQPTHLLNLTTPGLLSKELTAYVDPPKKAHKNQIKIQS